MRNISAVRYTAHQQGWPLSRDPGFNPIERCYPPAMGTAERPSTPIPDPAQPETAMPDVTDQTEPSKAISDCRELGEPPSPAAESASADPEISTELQPGVAPSLAAALAFFDSAFPSPPEQPPETASETDRPADPWTVPQRPLRSRPPPKPTQYRSASSAGETPPAPADETAPGEPSPTNQPVPVASPAAETPAEMAQSEPIPTNEPVPVESPAAETPAEVAHGEPSPTNEAAPVESQPAPLEARPSPGEQLPPEPPGVEPSAEDYLPTPPLPRPAVSVEPGRETMELFSTSLRRRSPLRFLLWAGSVIAAFGVGMVVSGAAEREALPAGSAASIAPAPPSASANRPVEAPVPGSDLSFPPGKQSIDELSKLDPSQRTRLEAVALGRHWSRDHLAELDRLGRDLEKNPAGLDDPSVREKLREFTRDRVTSRPALERLAEIKSPRALDLLYEVWTGSKDRNETTQLAEALLLAKDVRARASPALEIALALRDKPTDCAVIRQLVERAVRDADRRSAMLLVATGARKNCGAQGDGNCRKCLADAEHLRKAIQEAAARPEPTGPQTPPAR